MSVTGPQVSGGRRKDRQKKGKRRKGEVPHHRSSLFPVPQTAHSERGKAMRRKKRGRKRGGGKKRIRALANPKKREKKGEKEEEKKKKRLHASPNRIPWRILTIT